MLLFFSLNRDANLLIIVCYIACFKTQTHPTPLGSVCVASSPPDTVPAYQAPL